MKNSIQALLCELNICSETSIVPFYPRVRDREDVAVLRCEKSGVIFLSRSDHMEISHYEEMEGFAYWGVEERKRAALASVEDDNRRFSDFSGIITNKTWLDVGTGCGGILDILSPVAGKTIAVEPQREARENLIHIGYDVKPFISDVKETDVDVVTLFHVFEHLTEPLEALQALRSKMKPGGKLIIEVPHANDFLISSLESEPFKAFTFWSEHLVLHTRHSLNILIQEAGFSNIHIKGTQRYPLANHLHWLAKEKPGGHLQWSHLRSEALDAAYEDMLRSIDKTDTLIATAEA